MWWDGKHRHHTGMVLVKGLTLGREGSPQQGQEIYCHGREWGILGL